MNSASNNHVAGWKTAIDWYELRARLSTVDSAAWPEAFTEFFQTRLELRYLHPIRLLQEHGSFLGEGFSILAIQCSLLEFLESTAQGLHYRYKTKGQALGEFEYSSSRNIFVDFLSTRPPFRDVFDQASARDFYTNVRCALLHEARTKDGWRIWAEAADRRIANIEKRIVYRNGFQEALLSYIESYRQGLMRDTELQRAFIRKYDEICE